MMLCDTLTGASPASRLRRELVSAVLTEDSGGAKKLSRTDLDELFKVD